jgi:pycsar effector protein
MVKADLDTMTEPTQSERGTGRPRPLPAAAPSPLAAPPQRASAEIVSAEEKSSEGGIKLLAADRRAEFSEETHVYLREYISSADQKATFFFAALTALLAFLNAQNVPARWLKSVRLWSFVDGLGFISMLGLAIGAIFLLAVVFPRLKGSRRGLLFFNAIAEYEYPGEYAAEVLSQSDDQIVRTKLLHCHELSKVCKAKYWTLRAGFWVGTVGVGTGLLFLLLAKTGP